MSTGRGVPMSFLRLWPALAVCAAWLNLAAAAGEPAYRWEPNTLYRFDYLRATEIAEASGPARDGARRTEITAVLILEVESVRDGVALAELRLDCPRVTLPPLRYMDVDAGKVNQDAAGAWRAAGAMEQILLEARWKVELRPDGRIRVVSRQHADWRSWLRKLEQSARWPRAWAPQAAAMLEANFQLAPGSLDEELLPVFGPPAGAAAGSEGLESLRPRREVALRAMRPDGRAELTLRRAAPSGPPRAATFPMLETQDAPELRVTKVENIKGTALFDLTDGRLDGAEETYRVGLVCTLPGRAAQAERSVTLSYRLQRLAPAIREEAAGPPAGGQP